MDNSSERGDAKAAGAAPVRGKTRDVFCSRATPGVGCVGS